MVSVGLRHTKLVAPLLALAVLAGCAAGGSNGFRPAGTAQAMPIDTVLPSVTGDDFEGILVGQHGRVVVVNVWASWCAPCRTEAPLLQAAANAYPDVAFLGVDSKDSRAAALDFIDEFGLTYPNLYDEHGEVRQRLGLRGFPTTYIFGFDGALRASVVGGISEQRLAAQIQDARRA